ncbi:MAG: AmmeMemoRadiSam system radical SAM enzyme [Planctomycetes bacterium]|nr:AmmeMemoRadiSam system radical SAM enzyme [Planctomycetota bacterium]
MAHPAVLWDKLEGGAVRCRVCRRRCAIAPGKRGFCLTRENRGGELVSLTYGAVAALHVSPIEVKPLFHFLPGSQWLSMGSLGCNFRCPGCQNWELAHARVDANDRSVEMIAPARLVELAIERRCLGLSWTYNEPTLWLEYTIEASRLGRARGLLANYVTNGYITPEALDLLAPVLDAYRVDIKAFDREAYLRLANIADFDGVLDSAERAKKLHRLHVECVTNIVPGINDDDAQLGGLARWIAGTLGHDTPWHVTRFIPHLDLRHLPPTPVATLERAAAIGAQSGLHYVYVGNVTGHPAENTRCHACGSPLVQRWNHTVVRNSITNGQCPHCGAPVPGIWAP